MSLASTSPGMIWGARPRARRRASSSSAFSASRAALVKVTHVAVAPKARASSAKVRHAASTRSMAPALKRPVASTPCPMSVITECFFESTIAPSRTRASESRDETVPRSIAAMRAQPSRSSNIGNAAFPGPRAARASITRRGNRLALDALVEEKRIEYLDVPRCIVGRCLLGSLDLCRGVRIGRSARSGARST